MSDKKNTVNIRFDNVDDKQAQSIIRRNMKIKDEVAPDARFVAVRHKGIGLPRAVRKMLGGGDE